MRNIIGIIVSYVFIILIMLGAKLMEKAGREATRKFIHIMLCNWWFIAMYFFDNAFWAAFVPFTFVVINWVSYKKDLIKVMERGEKADGLGTVYYAISLMVLALLTFGPLKKPELGLVGILVMGYGDGLAAVVGRKIKSKEYHVFGHAKTIAGSITMLGITFILISAYILVIPEIGMEFWYLKSFLISLFITLIEALGVKGTDNLLVPFVTTLLMYFIP